MSEEGAQSPCLADWDNDGDYDMAIGFISGPVKMYLNNGDLTFKELGTLTDGVKEIHASDGGPCLVDWDGDGKLDMILGDGAGKVVFYKGRGDGGRSLEKGQTLIATLGAQGGWQPRKLDPKSPVGFSPASPGVRTKPYAADWNGDGKLDLLVGDYISIQAEAKNLTPAQKAELARLQKRMAELQKKQSTAFRRMFEAAYKKEGLKPNSRLTEEQSRRVSRTYMAMAEKDKSYRALESQMGQVYTKVQLYRPREEGTGFVWVYLRK